MCDKKHLAAAKLAPLIEKLYNKKQWAVSFEVLAIFFGKQVTRNYAEGDILASWIQWFNDYTHPAERVKSTKAWFELFLL